MFAILGTVAALWGNPFFTRMTPAGMPEVVLLLVLSGLFGLYVAIRRAACEWKKPGISGALGFFGVACPVCNKILILIFGGEVLMAYFEPVRLYLTVIAVALMAWMVWREIKLRHAPAV